jgi:hypothetical protein
MHDLIRPAVWIGGIALIVALACSTYVVWTNGASRNLGIGLGALFGACVLFILQLWFELQPTKSIDDFPAQFAADFNDKWIRKHPLRTTDGIAAFVNLEASGIMANASPAFKTDQVDKLVRDLTIVYLLTYLGGTSSPDECTKIEHAYILDKLAKAGNVFAGPPHALWHLPLCLPPGSILDVAGDAVTMTNPVCQVSFVIRYPFLEMSSSLPDTNMHMEMLPDGSTRYATVTLAIRATITYFALRAQDRKLKSYQSWASRVVNDAKGLFE